MMTTPGGASASAKSDIAERRGWRQIGGARLRQISTCGETFHPSCVGQVRTVGYGFNAAAPELGQRGDGTT